MRKNKDSDSPRVCEFCRFASRVALTGDMLCEKKGIVSDDHTCGKYIYDPLKRVPRKLPKLFVPEDLTEEL